MLQVIIPNREFYDEESLEFVEVKGGVLQLEHSLVSLSKWESKWLKPFMGKPGDNERTNEETIDYIRCMTINKNVRDEIYRIIPGDIFKQITDYIAAPMTATWFAERGNAPGSRKIVTAEVIYYWMIAHNIPMECQKWHLNRLLTLVRVCGEECKPPKKVGRREALANRKALNASRRKRANSRG